MNGRSVSFKRNKMTRLFIVLLVITMDTLAAVEELYCTSENEQSGSCTKVSDSEVHILLLGKTGAGKSTTGNTILGRKAFDTSVFADAVTIKTQQECANRFGRRLCVIDTPGLFDPRRSNEEVMNDITKWHMNSSDVVHAVMLVVEVARYTEVYQKCENVFRENFGRDIMNYVVVVFTGKSDLEKGNTDIETFVKPYSALRLLLNEVKDRYVVLGLEDDNNEPTSGMSTAKEDVNEVKRLIRIIEIIGKNSKGKYYTKETMEIAQESMRKSEEEKLSEMKRIKEKETQERLRLEKAKQDEERKRLKEKLEREEDNKRKQKEKLEKERQIAEKEKEEANERFRKQRTEMLWNEIVGRGYTGN